MFKHNFKYKILSSSMLIAPAAIMLFSAQPALATCTLTPGGGPVSVLADGAVVTCATAGGDHMTAIGNGADGVAATVNIEAGATVDVAGTAIEIDDATITLGAGATLRGNSSDVIYNGGSDNSTFNITLGDNATITSQGGGRGIYIYGEGGNNTTTITLSGDNANISTQGRGSEIYGLGGGNTANITLSGDGANITTQGDFANGSRVSSYDGDDTANITLSGDNANITTQGDFANGSNLDAMYGDRTANITLSGDGANITTQGNGARASNIYSYDGDTTTTIILSGDNSNIATQGDRAYGSRILGYRGDHTTTITLSGDGANITTQGDRAGGSYIRSLFNLGDHTTTITLSGDGSHITTYGTNARAVYGLSGNQSATITLGANTSLISTQSEAIKLDSTLLASDASTIDSAGLIQGGTKSILLDDGDDSLTLRTGSNLASVTGADLGAGTDTLTLVGNATEDEVFLNVETVEVNADATGWALTSTSSFDDFNINTGLFSNNGNLTIANALTVDSGASFGGTGTTIGNVTNNGITAPGNSVGTQIITGNFVQGAGGTLAIEFDNTGTDFLDISGTATLDGAVTFTEDEAGVSFDTPLTFLDAAGGITGGFVSVPDVVATSAGVAQVAVDVGATAATLTLTAGTGLSANTGSAASNNVINALNNANTSDAPAVAAIINTINASASSADTFASQSGVVTTTAVGAAGSAVGQVTNIVRGRISAATGKTGATGISAGSLARPSSSASVANIEPAAGGDDGEHCDTNKNVPYAQRRSNGCAATTRPKKQTAPKKLTINPYPRTAWIEGVGGFGDVDGDSTARGAEYDTYGVALGADIQLDGDVTLGTFAAFSDTESEVNGLRDESTVRSYQAGIYAAKNIDEHWRVNGSVSGSYLDYETTRFTAAGTATADFDGYGAFGYVEAAYDINPQDAHVISPYAGLEGSAINHESYSESGGGVLNLDVDSETTEQLSSQLGVKYAGKYQGGKLTLSPTVKIGWEHEFLDRSAESTSNFSGAPTAIINSEGPEQSRDSAVIGLDLNIESPSKKVSLYTSYDGRISQDAQDHIFTAGLKWKW